MYVTNLLYSLLLTNMSYIIVLNKKEGREDGDRQEQGGCREGGEGEEGGGGGYRRDRWRREQEKEGWEERCRVA